MEEITREAITMKYKACYRILAVGIVAALLLSSTLLLSSIPFASAEEEDNGFLKEEGKEIELLGGGGLVKIRFGNDAWFGVIYGTEDKPNSIIIASIAQRYLGVAEIYDTSGGLISKQYPIRIQSIFAVRLDSMFEFNDTNENDICDYRRTGDGLQYSDFYMHEPIYKGVSLVGAWEKSEVTRTQGENSTTWEFTLTARNLSYTEIGEVNTTGKVLEKLMFGFRLTASVRDVERDVPVYKIHVGTSNNEVKDSTLKETRHYTGKGLSYSAKVDHLIEGWDFEENNTNPHLLLETSAIIGNRIPIGVAKWMKHEFISNINGTGKASYVDENGTEEVLNEDNALSEGSNFRHPKRLRNPRIELDDNWERVGRLTWVTNVTTTNDGVSEEGEMHFQVQGHRHLRTHGVSRSAIYRGFALKGGFSYPAGESIYHDPT
ncbi:MAG: hypothetical protein KAU14_03765, partial [Thermoplasmata archaeon]|nr:hypothetical protein [Thermoplasmata archaeon]